MFISFTRRENGDSVMLNAEIIEKIEAVDGGCFVSTAMGEAFLVKETFEEVSRQLKELGLSAE